MEKQTSRAGGFWLWTLCWQAPLPQPPLSLMEGGGVSVSRDKSASPGTYCLQGGGAGSTWHCQGDTAWKRWETCPRPQFCCWVGLAAAGPEVPSSAACEDSDRPACLRFPASTGAETVSLPSSTCQSSSGAVCFFPGLLQLAGRTSKKSVWAGMF